MCLCLRCVRVPCFKMLSPELKSRSSIFSLRASLLFLANSFIYLFYTCSGFGRADVHASLRGHCQCVYFLTNVQIKMAAALFYFARFFIVDAFIIKFHRRAVFWGGRSGNLILLSSCCALQSCIKIIYMPSRLYMCTWIWFGLRESTSQWWFGHQSDASDADADNLIIHYKKNNEVGAHSMNILFICNPLSGSLYSRRVSWVLCVCVQSDGVWVSSTLFFVSSWVCTLWLLLLRGVKFYLFRSSAILVEKWEKRVQLVCSTCSRSAGAEMYIHALFLRLFWIIQRLLR